MPEDLLRLLYLPPEGPASNGEGAVGTDYGTLLGFVELVALWFAAGWLIGKVALALLRPWNRGCRKWVY